MLESEYALCAVRELRMPHSWRVRCVSTDEDVEPVAIDETVAPDDADNPLVVRRAKRVDWSLFD